MKRSLAIVSVLAALGLFFTGVTLPTPADAQSAQENRLKLMKTMGGNMRKLKMAADTSTMLAAAKEINATTKKLASDDLWPKGSHGGETRAKIEIWQDMADFKAKLKATEEAAANLIKVSMGGNLGAAKGAFGAMGRTCGGCHKVFRAPKKK